MTSPLEPLSDYPDVELALAYGPAPVKEALRCIWRLDAILAEALTKSQEPVLIQVRLAWWRDQLADPASWPKARDPMLLALNGQVPGLADPAVLSELAGAWSIVAGADGAMDADAWHDHATARGRALFGALSQSETVRDAGTLWALVDLITRIGEERAVLQHLAQAAAELAGRASLTGWPPGLKPLRIMTEFAKADLEDWQRGRRRRSRGHRLWLAMRHGLLS